MKHLVRLATGIIAVLGIILLLALLGKLTCGLLPSPLCLPSSSEFALDIIISFLMGGLVSVALFIVGLGFYGFYQLGLDIDDFLWRRWKRWFGRDR